MTTTEILEAVKIDLGTKSTAYDARLTQMIESARAYIEQEGITLTDSVADSQLVIMYTAWLFRKRDEETGMPRMLRYALNNRVFKEKAGA